MLDGGVAVPCNSQSAIARFKSFEKGRAIGVSPCIGVMTFRSCATEYFEPCQVLTEAALRSSFSCAARLPGMSTDPRETSGGCDSNQRCTIFII